MDGDGPLVAGRYRMHEKIGSGGMGTVWRATDEMLDRVVAIKRVHLPQAPHDRGPIDRGPVHDRVTDEARERIRREARIAARLHHPAVVTVFDVLVVDKDPWLVLEYVESESLAAALDTRGPFTPRQAAAVGVRVADALTVAHAAGVVHRDVKPGNVLLGVDGAVKLADFGIAHAAGDVVLTGTNVVTGTPAYIAPEVADGHAGGPAADVYSLGATLYTAIEGRPPFGSADGNVLQLLRRMATEHVPPPQRAGPLSSVLQDMLDADPARRPTAVQVRESLGRVAAAAGRVDDEPTTAPPDPCVGSDRARRRWTPIGAVAAVVVAVVVVAALIAALVVVSRPSSPGRTPSAAPATATPQPAGPVAQEPAPDDMLPADPRTADPCSLTDPAAFESVGASTRAVDLAGYEECQLDVLPSTGGSVLVLVSLGRRLGPDASLPDPVEVRGDLRVGAPAESAVNCQRTILLADRTQVIVSVIPRDGADVDRCGMADVGTRLAVRRLETTGIGVRTTPEPPDSLARLDACALLDPGTVAGSGLVADDADPGFADLTCQWGDDDLQLEVGLGRTRQLSAEDGDPVEVAGREVRILAGSYSGNPSICLAQVPHRAFTASNGEARIESLQIVYTGEGTPDELCRITTELVADVVPRLPPAG